MLGYGVVSGFELISIAAQTGPTTKTNVLLTDAYMVFPGSSGRVCGVSILLAGS